MISSTVNLLWCNLEICLLPYFLVLLWHGFSINTTIPSESDLKRGLHLERKDSLRLVSESIFTLFDLSFVTLNCWLWSIFIFTMSLLFPIPCFVSKSSRWGFSIYKRKAKGIIYLMFSSGCYIVADPKSFLPTYIVIRNFCVFILLT